MAAYIIQCLLNKKRDYSNLKQRIEKLGNEAKINPMTNLWIVHSRLDSSEIRDQLLPFIDARDTLFVIKIDTDDWASWNLKDHEVQWLNHSVDIATEQ